MKTIRRHTTGRVRRVAAGHQGRRGTSLIENVAVMTTGMVILSLAIGILTLFLRAEQAATAHLAGMLARDRIGRTFRQDLHAAREVAVTSNDADLPNGLDITLPGDARIQYRVEGDDKIVRLEEAAGQPSRRESYILPGLSRLTFEVTTDEPRFVTLTCEEARAIISSTPGSEAEVPALPRRFTVTARLGSDARFQRAAPANIETPAAPPAGNSAPVNPAEGGTP